MRMLGLKTTLLRSRYEALGFSCR